MITYVDLDSPALQNYPALAAAVAEGRSLPLVLTTGDTVKSPAVLSFAWFVNEYKAMGVLDGVV